MGNEALPPTPDGHRCSCLESVLPCLATPFENKSGIMNSLTMCAPKWTVRIYRVTESWGSMVLFLLVQRSETFLGNIETLL